MRIFIHLKAVLQTCATRSSPSCFTAGRATPSINGKKAVLITKRNALNLIHCGSGGNPTSSRWEALT